MFGFACVSELYEWLAAILCLAIPQSCFAFGMFARCIASVLVSLWCIFCANPCHLLLVVYALWLGMSCQ